MTKSTAGKLVAMDGKTVRGAFGGVDGGGALHLVHAWVSENAMVLGQYATEVKSNEVTAIPELLRLLDVRGAVVSIDAIGCQRGIADASIRNTAPVTATDSATETETDLGCRRRHGFP